MSRQQASARQHLTARLVVKRSELRSVHQIADQNIWKPSGSELMNVRQTETNALRDLHRRIVDSGRGCVYGLPLSREQSQNL